MQEASVFTEASFSVLKQCLAGIKKISHLFFRVESTKTYSDGTVW